MQNSRRASITADTGRRRLSGKLSTLLLLSVLTSSAVADDVPLFAGKKGLTVTVGAPYIDMHTGPGRGYPVFHVAEKHDALRLLKSRTDWYKVVTVDGETGWVPHAKLKNAMTRAITTDGAELYALSILYSRDPTK